MPIRIYDIAKKHGIKPAEVIKTIYENNLSFGKLDLKASSSIDKVTAESLEKHLPQLPEVVVPQEPAVSTPASKTNAAEPVAEVTTESETTIAKVVSEVSTPTEEPSIANITKELQVSETGSISEPISESTLTKGEASVIQPVDSLVIPPVISTATDWKKTTDISSDKQQVQTKPIVEETENKTDKESLQVTEETETLERSVVDNERKIEETTENESIIIIEPDSNEPKEETTITDSEAQAVQLQPTKIEVGAKIGSIDLSKFTKSRPQPPPKKQQKKPNQQAKKQQQAKPNQQTKQQQLAKQQPAQKPQKFAPKTAQPLSQVKKGKEQQKPQQVFQHGKPKDIKPSKFTPQPPKAPVLAANAPVVSIKPPIVVRDLATVLGKKAFQVIAELLKRRVLAQVNDFIPENIAKDVAATFGINLVIEKRGTKIEQLPVIDKNKDKSGTEDPSKLKPRPPVVTIMGHVDHGKTTLLDAIRQSNVAASESGGITQHIGAYTIEIPHPDDKKKMKQITFIDTPGHAAFSAMRARGANVTDIVVLVVAADDGVMPQTIEALNHAKAAKVPIVVAVNKCDHPSANPNRIREQLSKLGLTPEDWGGDTIFVDVSALKKQGIDKLLEMIVLRADVMDLKANPDCPAFGNVIESALEPGGPTATLLIKRGTLRVGDFIVCGQYYGKVKALINDKNERLKEAKPSYAVKVLGLNGVPEAGISFEVVDSIDKAREIAEKQIESAKQNGQTLPIKKITLESLLQSIETSKAKILKVVVKADMQGSVEAITKALKDIKSDKVSLEIIHSGVGAVSESDVMLASASKGIIIGFHTKLEHGVSDIAKKEGVQIKLYSIIYELIDEVKLAMAGLLEPVVKEVNLGRADVKKVFELSKGGKVAGCMVVDGSLIRGAKVRVYRGKELVYEGIISSLRHFQDEVNETRAGMECGVRIEGFNDFNVGDTLHCYKLEKTLQSID